MSFPFKKIKNKKRGVKDTAYKKILSAGAMPRSSEKQALDKLVEGLIFKEVILNEEEDEELLDDLLELKNMINCFRFIAAKLPVPKTSAQKSASSRSSSLS